MQDWDNLRFFLAVARSGSLSAAATKLGVNQSTVSRRINSFEEQMKVRLFERLSTGYQLTAEAEDLLQRTVRIEEEALAIERNIMGKNIELKGPIRLTTSLVMVDYLLMPILREFSALHPGIELQLDISDNIYNLSQREADIGLRVTRNPIPENLIGRELGKIQLAVYGSKRYIEKYKQNKKKVPLKWIGEDNNDTRPSWLDTFTGPLELTMRTTDVLATRSAIKHGLGVGRLPMLVGSNTPGLTCFEEAPLLPSIPIWLLTHVDMRQVARMRVFNAFLSEKISGSLLNLQQ